MHSYDQGTAEEVPAENFDHFLPRHRKGLRSGAKQLYRKRFGTALDSSGFQVSPNIHKNRAYTKKPLLHIVAKFLQQYSPDF